METNKNNTGAPIWVIIVMAATITVLVGFIVLQQFLPFLTASESQTVAPVPSPSIGESKIKEIYPGLAFFTANGLKISFLGIRYENGKGFDRYYANTGTTRHYGLPSNNILLILSVRIENLKTTPQNYYHFARCFINGKKAMCASLQYAPTGEGITTKAFHSEDSGDNYYDGEIDGGRSVELEILFSVPSSTSHINKDKIEFDYYCDVTEQSYNAKKEQGTYPEMCRMKVG